MLTGILKYKRECVFPEITDQTDTHNKKKKEP